METNIQEYTLTADTYKDIDEITKGELMERLEKDFPFPEITFQNMKLNYTGRAKIILNIAQWLGLDLDNEQFMFVMVENNRLLCEAGAGSGKTTVSQLRLIKEKLFYGAQPYQILSLAYNGHAAEDMEEKHTEMADIIKGKGLKGLEISSGIMARTFHSMALQWIKQFPEEFGIKHVAQTAIQNRDGSQSYGKDDNEWKLTDREVMDGYKMSIKAMSRMFGFEQDIHESQIYKIRDFNTYIGETMTPTNEWWGMNKLKEIRLPKIPQEFFNRNEEHRDIDQNSEKVLILSELFKAYSNYKKMKKKIEFGDVISRFTQKLFEDEEFRERIHKAYPVILVDEYQDFTKVMTTALQLMVGKDTKLIAIGDGDQSIYGFRGTDSFNCLKFKDMYKEDVDGTKHKPTVTTLGTNRRCDEAIVKVAKNIIETNTLRYDKEIKSFKSGGAVRSKIFHTTTEQVEYVVENIKNKTIEQLNQTCLSYRNKESSMIAATVLFENNIPFSIGSGFQPYEDRLTTGLLDTLYLLLYPDNPERQKEILWRVLPGITTWQVRQVVDSSEPDPNDANSFKKKMFWELDLSKYHNINGFVRSLTTLQSLSEQIRANGVLAEIVPKLFNLYDKYYWANQKKSRTFPDELQEQVLRYYNVNLSLSDFLNDHTTKVERLTKMRNQKQGIYLTTFHGLKGLEYDEHYIMDLENSIFPGLEKERQFNTSEEQIQELKEESIRLFYVAVTRARHSLHLLWDANNPSEFQSLVMEDKKVTQQHIEKALGSSMLTSLSKPEPTLTEPTREEVSEELTPLQPIELDEQTEELVEEQTLEPLLELEPLETLEPLKTPEPLNTLEPLELLTELTPIETGESLEKLEPLEALESIQLEPLTELTIEEVNNIKSVKEVKTYCKLCKGLQYQTPNGLTCEQEHGDVGSLTAQEVKESKFAQIPLQEVKEPEVKVPKPITPKQNKLNTILKGIRKLS